MLPLFCARQYDEGAARLPRVDVHYWLFEIYLFIFMDRSWYAIELIGPRPLWELFFVIHKLLLLLKVAPPKVVKLISFQHQQVF